MGLHWQYCYTDDSIQQSDLSFEITDLIAVILITEENRGLDFSAG